MTPAQIAKIMSLVDACIAGARAGDALRHRAAVEAALRDAPQAEHEPNCAAHIHQINAGVCTCGLLAPSAPTAVEPDERAELIVQAGEEMSFEAWFKTMCPVDGINAKIAARAAWQARASKGTPL